MKRKMEHRISFEIFKSNVCHMVKDMGDLDFIIEMLESNKIREYYNKKWYPESLYLLAMVDYLSRENDLPVSIEYSDIRATRLRDTVFPASIVAMSAAAKDDSFKKASSVTAIPEFKQFNIIEYDVRNVK